jgi:FkbM family methyltransferase
MKVRNEVMGNELYNIERDTHIASKYFGGNSDRGFRLVNKMWENRVKSIQDIKEMLKNRIESVEIEKETAIIKLSDGSRFRWNYESFYSLGNLVQKGDIDPDEREILSQLVKPGDCVFDVGTYWGWYTILFCNLVKNSGSIHCFEPVPPSYEMLLENVKINEYSNVLINNVALSDVNGEVDIFVPKNQYGLASLKQHFDGENEHYKCSSIQLDEYVSEKKIKNIALIKVDIEGAEMLFLRGGKTTLQSEEKPILMLEYLEKFAVNFGYTFEDVMTLMMKYGYRTYIIKNGKLKQIYKDISFESANIICLSEKHEEEFKHILA